MEKKRKSDFKLPSVDDLFTTEAQRQEEQMTSGRIMNIPISEIDDFEGHPFKVRDDEEMEILMNSIKEHGVIEPATVRKKEDGRYEMISGHRRKHASERLGLETIRCEIVDISRDDAILQMVESNFHREHILPSEKAFAYKMRLDAIKRQGKRTDLTSSPPGTKLRSSDEITRETGDSRNQIYRYIALTNLCPEILQMVDDGKIKMRPAVEISYLEPDEQAQLYEAMEENDCTPSHAQTLVMKKLSQEGNLTDSKIRSIMEEEKPNQRVKPFLPEAIMNLLPAGMTEKDEILNHICRLLEGYNRKNNIRTLNQPLRGQSEITDYKGVVPNNVKDIDR